MRFYIIMMQKRNKYFKKHDVYLHQISHQKELVINPLPL